MSLAITEFREPLRFLLGDLNPQEQSYSNADLDAGVKSAVRLASVDGLELTACRNRIQATGGTDPTSNQFALLSLKTAEIFVSANPDGYQYRTRALAERLDGWTNLLEALRGRIYELQAGDGFLTWQEWSQFLYGTDGINRRMVEAILTGAPPVRAEPYPQ
jgi:hypothetical protein